MWTKARSEEEIEEEKPIMSYEQRKKWKNERIRNKKSHNKI